MAMQVTKVNLPERTRARFDADSNQQRVQKPHDIRSAVPLVDYTNPAKFPSYVYREFPKMPLLDGNKPIVIDEAGGILLFYEPADEADFMEMNPELAEEIERNAPAKAIANVIAEQTSEIENLRAKLRAAGIDPEERKRPRNALAGATRVAAEPDAGSAEGGLRDALPKTGDGPKNPLKKKH